MKVKWLFFLFSINKKKNTLLKNILETLGYSKVTLKRRAFFDQLLI